MKITRRHNKSGDIHLSILKYNDINLELWIEFVKKQRKDIDDGLINGSRCTLIKAKDGRLTVSSKKVGFAYQIIAFEKFGRTELMKVPASKSQTDLLISHLCGTMYCCTSEHLILESKEINEQRIHCHWCIRNILKKKKKSRME
jgi:hypothetical protein